MFTIVYLNSNKNKRKIYVPDRETLFDTLILINESNYCSNYKLYDDEGIQYNVKTISQYTGFGIDLFHKLVIDFDYTIMRNFKMQKELDKINYIDPWGALNVYLGSELATALELAWDKQHPNVNVDEYYHTFEHMLGVAKIALYIAEQADIQTPHSLIILTLAALFHDYHHTLGTHSDNVNIERATINVESLFNKLGITNLIEPVNKLIASTLYVPGSTVILSEHFDSILRPLGQILHDADYLWATLTQDPEVILTNLRNEACIHGQREVTREEMLQGQLNFQSNAIMLTPTGQKLWNDWQPSYIELIEKSI